MSKGFVALPASTAALLVAAAIAAAATVAHVDLADHSVRRHGDPARGAEYALGPSVSLLEPFTIESRFQYTGGRSEPVIWIAGLFSGVDAPPDAPTYDPHSLDFSPDALANTELLALNPDAPVLSPDALTLNPDALTLNPDAFVFDPDVLALKWSQETVGWFPAWKLHLESRRVLLPPGLVDRRDGSRSLIELSDARPQPGHEYRAAMSYNPADATLSVMLEDVTEGSIIVAAHMQLADALRFVQAPFQTLVPGAGWSVSGAASLAPDAPPVNLLGLTVSHAGQQFGLPLALKRHFRSALLEVSPDTGAYRRKAGQDYLAGDAVALRLEWPQEPVAGDVRILLASAGEERLLAAVPWQAGPRDIAFDPGAVPLGESVLVLEYTDGAHHAEIARHTVRVVEARLRANYVIRGLDYDRNLVIAELTLAPDLGVVRNAELVVQASYPGAGFGSPGAPGSPSALTLLRTPIDVLEQAVSFPLLIPAPPEGGSIRLDALVKPGHIAVAGGGHQFTVRGVETVPSDADLFPFVVNPWQESPDNLTNVSHWLEKPAGKDGFVRVENGRFVTGDGTPLRFLGVNCAFAGCFPSHTDAERVARQLARFGINLVRFHHMDMQEAPSGIWRRGVFPRQLDPQQLDRLDYFIYQLKENGIYVNLNLHVSRTMTPQEGYPEPERRPDFDKGLSIYDPGILEHQKAYARELLTHRNPYTGNRYVDEPAVAMIEITNENGLILMTRQGRIDALPQRYQEALDERWNRWLAARYHTTEALAEAWGGGALSAGVELAANGRLEQGLLRWSLETDAARQASIQLVPGGGPVVGVTGATVDVTGPAGSATASIPSGGPAGTAVEPTPLPALQVNVIEKGSVAWRPQFYHTGLNLKPGRVYLISFWLKASRPHEITANLMMHHDPWTGFGSFRPAVTTEWRRFEFVAQVPESAAVREGRVSFTDLQAGTVYWVTNLSVQEVQGEGLGLPLGEGLESGVTRPKWQTLPTRSPQVRQDYIEFLWDVEQEFFREMYRFIKEELGARAPVSGTQVPWSPAGIQAQLDYVDAHAYWNHPEFPGAAWDPSNWIVRNNSMVTSDSGGTMSSLARSRVAGKPFVVSEYNHPAPNTYSSEAFLLAGAYGAFQDWDGLVAFAWSHDANFWPQRIPSFFDIKSHPTKLVTLPAVAALFLRGDVRPGDRLVTASLPSELQRRRLIGGAGLFDSLSDIPAATPLQYRVAAVMGESGSPGSPKNPDLLALDSPAPDLPAPGVPVPDLPAAGPLAGPLPSPEGPIVTSDTSELRWERTGPGRAVVVVDTQRSKAVIGYGAGRTFDLSGVSVTPGPTRQQGWSAITLTVMEGESFAGPGRILLTATGYAENTGMGWERLGGDAVTVRNRWGEAPSLVEGIPARIELPVPPERIAVYALDGAGDRRESVPVKATAPGADKDEAGRFGPGDLGPVSSPVPGPGSGTESDSGSESKSESETGSGPETGSGRTLIEIGPEYRTLWYEIVVAGP